MATEHNPLIRGDKEFRFKPIIPHQEKEKVEDGVADPGLIFMQSILPSIPGRDLE